MLSACCLEISSHKYSRWSFTSLPQNARTQFIQALWHFKTRIIFPLVSNNVFLIFCLRPEASLIFLFLSTFSSLWYMYSLRWYFLCNCHLFFLHSHQTYLYCPYFYNLNFSSKCLKALPASRYSLSSKVSSTCGDICYSITVVHGTKNMYLSA